MSKLVLLIGLTLVFLISGCGSKAETANVSTNSPSPVSTTSPDANSKSAQSTEDIVKAYMEKGNIKLIAKDVQFDMQNNLDKDFVINGVAKLSNYYNYGFKDEKNYFNVSIRQDGGEAAEQWNLYFDRAKNSELFDNLKKGELYIITQGNVPSKAYQKGQGNMAVAGNVIWVK